MCDIVEIGVWNSQGSNDEQGCFTEGDTEIFMKLCEHDVVHVHHGFVTKLGGKVFCKHPDTDWHEMEVKPGQGLDCPAETELKFVLPKPYVLGSENES